MLHSRGNRLAFPPGTGLTMATQVDTTAKGTVVRILEYGAIVRLDDGRTGLVHISQITDAYVRDIRDYLEERDVVAVRILGPSPKGRLEFSIKQLGGLSIKVRKPDPVGVAAAAPLPQVEVAPAPVRPASFEERLSRFLKDSEERMHELKRHVEGRRGRR